MLEKGLDKRSIVGGYRTQIKRSDIQLSVISFLFLVFLAACTTPSRDAVTSSAELLSDESSAQPDQLLDQAIQADRMGDFEAALPLYVELLSLRPNRMVSERASRIAAETGRWDIALEASSAWMQADPVSLPAKQMNIVAMFRLGRINAAIAALADQIERADDVRASWRMALGLLSVAPPENTDSTQAHDQVRALLDQLIAETGNEPDSAFAYFQRSRLVWQQGNASLALEFALKSSRAEADYVNTMWAAGLAVQQHELELAQTLYRQARLMESDPGSERAIQAALAESEVMNEMDRPDQSLRLLESLPDTLETIYAQALLQLELDNADTALQQWQQLTNKAIQASMADQDRAAWLVAVLAEVLGQEKEAIEWYGRVDGEHRSNARMRQASLLAETGQLDQSRALLAAMRDGSEPTLTEQTYLVESELLVRQGLVDEALDLLIEAVTRQPGSIALLYSRAMAAVQADQLELAEQDLRAIIQRDSQNAIALNALGYTLSDRTDRQGEALRLIERALALEPDNPAILDSMGWVLFKLGQPEQALPYLERAAAGDFHPEIVSHLIEVLWTLGQEQEALNWLNRARPEFFEDAVFADMLARTGLAD